LADCLQRMRGLGAEAAEMALVGGGAGSALWRRILAAQLRIPLAVVGRAEGPALGAAILAQVGCGLQPDLPTAVRQAVPPVASVPAEPHLVAIYCALHERWGRAYPALTAAGLMAPP
jgi:sugar (pentulose or hexulose) kinase